MIAARRQLDATREELLWMLRASRPPRIRTRRQFAEQEIVLPTGRYAGHRFQASRQPYAALWLDLCDRGPWRRRAATGPTQSGKSLTCFIIPILYHLFERCETIGVGIPTQDMAGDKWREDILPVIERTRYRELLPTRGAGSKGSANPTHIKFLHGPTLRFLSAGGGDKKRAAFTVRTLCLTEVDGYDLAGGESREADKVKQMEARTLSYGDQAEIYLECTVSIPEGRIWSEFQAGTRSRIVRPCPHCRAWVTPEREHLVGWEEAETELDAAALTAFACPACGARWSDEERFAANRQSRVLHGDQSIDEHGQVQGEIPRTGTLGFRWSAVDNHFWPAGLLGGKEWSAARHVDEENAKRELLQFFWVRPYVPPQLDTRLLDLATVTRRVAGTPQNVAPPETHALTMGVDVGKWLLHWVLLAGFERGGGVICAYGRVEVPSDDLPEDRALLVALRQLREEIVLPGIAQEGQAARRAPLQVWIDSGYQSDVVYAFTAESGDRFRPTKGHGTGDRLSPYATPQQISDRTQLVGERYHFTYQPAKGVWLVHVDVDHWKGQLHSQLAVGQPDQPLPAGAISLYQASSAKEHLTFGKHLTAEQLVEEFVPGRGTLRRWKKLRDSNHYLDAAVLALAAGHLCGVRRDPPPVRRAAPVDEPPRFTTPDGRPYLVTERK